MVAVKINLDINGPAYEGSEEGKERGRGSAVKVFAKDVKNVFIFGNHSTTQVSYNFNFKCRWPYDVDKISIVWWSINDTIDLVGLN